MALENPQSEASAEGAQPIQQREAPDTAQEKTAKSITAAPTAEPAHEHFHSTSAFLNWLGACITGILCLSFALTAHHIYSPGLKVGDRAERDMVATHAAIIVNKKATEAARQNARRAVVPVFVKTTAGDQKALQSLKQNLAEIADLQAHGITALPDINPAEQLEILKAPDSSRASKIDAATNKSARPKAGAAKLSKSLELQCANLNEYRRSHSDLDDDKLLIAVSSTAADWKIYETTVNATVQRVCKVFHRLPLEDNSVWVETVYEFLPDSWTASIRKATSRIVCAVLEPNIEINQVATEAKSQKIASAVKPVTTEINVGQLLVPKNGEITRDNIELLSEMGYGDINSWPLIWTLVASVAAAGLLVGIFLYEFEPKVFFSTSSLGLILTVSTIVMVLAVLLGKSYPNFVPLPAAALVLTVFYGQTVATAVVLPLAIFFAVDRLVDFNNLVALGTAAGAAIGFYPRRRHGFMSTGLVIGLMELCGFAGACALTKTVMLPTTLGKTLGFEFLGGLSSAIVAVGSLPFLEGLFGLITPFRLAELTDADQPLLRKLQENAPGTYQHSLAVANLAEAGARALEGNVNLVRAGAFYHDVGKMVRPRYFIENQLGATNPHDSMTPEQSRERVLAHVTDGIALAKQYGLPQAVQDFIPMHQGTTLMAYFYHKACVRDGVDKVDPLSYRYPGPKPHSKETAIVMLADVSEAVTHSMKEPTQDEVETAMTKVFQNRWDDGQFSESSLTYTELQKVKQAFVHVWRTLHHERLKYPSTTTGRMAVPPSREDPSPLSEYSNSTEIKENN